MANMHMQRCSLYAPRESKIKTMKYYYSLIRTKPKTLTIPNTGKNVEQQKLTFIAGGNSKCLNSGTLEDNLAVSYKTEHIFTIQSSSYAPWYLSKCIKNLCPHKSLWKVV